MSMPALREVAHDEPAAPLWPLGGVAAGPPADRYSRRVARLRIILPAVGFGLLLIVGVWPRVAPIVERFSFAWPAIDLREARELRILNPRYVGTDRANRPFVVTAAVGRQVPDRQELMSLEEPRADMKTEGGSGLALSAASGIYQGQGQLLDLFGNVTLVHANGMTFVTEGARVEIASNAASGRDPVAGHGPQADVKGEGFQMFDKGDTIVFTGHSELVTKAAAPTEAPAQPPAVPAEVARAAAQAEAAERKPAKPAATPAKTAAPAPKSDRKRAASKPAPKKAA